MAEKEDLRVIKTKRIIRTALIDLMAEKEISVITITELSERAMINRKTFYRHYTSVSEVVKELENEILSEFADALNSANRSCLDVSGVIADISALILRRKEYFSKMMKLNPDLFTKGRIKAMLRRAVEVSVRSYGKTTDRETLAAVSQYTVSGVLALYSEWFDNGCRSSLDDLTKIACQMVRDGLSGIVPTEKLLENASRSV